MSRVLLKLGVFLLLGAIVNVALAWGCAALAQFPFPGHSVERAIMPHPEYFIRYSVSRDLGVTRIHVNLWPQPGPGWSGAT